FTIPNNIFPGRVNIHPMRGFGSRQEIYRSGNLGWIYYQYLFYPGSCSSMVILVIYVMSIFGRCFCTPTIGDILLYFLPVYSSDKIFIVLRCSHFQPGVSLFRVIGCKEEPTVRFIASGM